MVHLAGVTARKAETSEFGAPPRRASVVPGLEHISLDAPGDDEFSTSVYGSRFAAEDLPAHEMPEKEMPKEIAYRMIKDELSLDGNPMLKYVED
jgi:glutamate decarboxylase